MLKKNITIADLYRGYGVMGWRYYIIQTPIKWLGRGIKHMAVIDCKNKIILEGFQKDGYLDVQCSSIETLGEYIKDREKKVGFNFSDNDISMNSIETMQSKKKELKTTSSFRVLQEIIPWLTDEDYKSYEDDADEDFSVDDIIEMQCSQHFPCENKIEQRWRMVDNWPDKVHKYDIEGKEGMNCEMIAFKVLYNSYFTPSGIWGGHAKNIGILDQFGDFNSSKR